jgi:hypothetical protein
VGWILDKLLGSVVGQALRAVVDGLLELWNRQQLIKLGQHQTTKVLGRAEAELLRRNAEIDAKPMNAGDADAEAARLARVADAARRVRDE